MKGPITVTTHPTSATVSTKSRTLKAKNPKIKAVISIGGWMWYNTGLNPNQEFAKVAATQTGRENFVKSCVDQFVKGIKTGYNNYEGVFDGIDIDWEYPGECGGEDPELTAQQRGQGPTERKNWLLLLQEFRKQLDAYKPGLLLTAAVTLMARKSRPTKTKNLVAGLDKALNWINVMTYDFHGAFDTTTNHNAPLGQNPRDPNAAQKFTTKDAMAAWVAAGIPKNHLLPGLAFYGRGWANVSITPNADGLFNASAGNAGGVHPVERKKETPATKPS